jgi:metal-dependent amidase/aminoacylase/carboxypeptidase family protein
MHSAHAALSPWEGKNSLDAAVLAYNNISALRQQLHPTHRVHGIIEGKDWAPNSKRNDTRTRSKFYHISSYT